MEGNRKRGAETEDQKTRAQGIRYPESLSPRHHGQHCIRTISKRFLHGNLMRQTCIRNTESLSPRHHSSKTRVSYTHYKPSPSHPFSTSSSGPSCSNSKSNSGFIGWYLNQLESHQLSQKLSLLSLFTLLLISPLR